MLIIISLAITMDDFIVRALLGGIAVALATGPLGCFILWKKMAFFGDAVAHSSMLGVAIGVLLGVSNWISIAVFAAIFSLFIAMPMGKKLFSSDTILGMVTSGSLALGMIIITLCSPAKFNILSLLFGDILATSYTDIIIMYSGAATVLVCMAYIWRALLLATINEDLARVEGVNVKFISLIYTLMVASVVALAVKIVGVLLVSAMLVIPAATARIIAKTPEFMAMNAIIVGIIAIISGIILSLKLDSPAGPSIVVALLIVFGVVRVVK